ncbi:MAG: discoidin domain-containing protein [Opitutaceae bacterium]
MKKQLRRSSLTQIGSFLWSFLLASFLLASSAMAQITVNSLQALKPYLNDSNVNVKLSPGTYTVTANDLSSGALGQQFTGNTLGTSFAIFPIEGNNSTYDFTGVTINVKTEVFQALPGTEIREFWVRGNNNVLKNLTLVDDGDVDDAPSHRAQSIAMDGEYNRIEGFHVTVKGSYPYGYGDIFGKGGGSVIGHHKHSACLVRGNSNHVKNCTFIHRAYGHGIFMQGANDPIIEGCYVEGELSTTDNVLAETNSPASNVNFETVWGFNLSEKPGYRFSLQEDGIRAYNGGATIISGVEYSRGVTNVTVIDCTVVKMRSGVTIGWAGGTKQVENCTVLGCETGYWFGSDATVTGSRGDSSVGPLMAEDVARSNSNIELTLLDDHVSRIGDRPSMYIGGTNHNITLHDGTTSANNDIRIHVSGERISHRWLIGSTSAPPNKSASGITFLNETDFPVILGNDASNNTIQSVGSVTNNGSSNSVSQISNNVSVTNVALNGTASQSSTAYSGVESRAIDGNTNGAWSGGSVTHTSNEYQAWWQVDLGNSYDIHALRIYGRNSNKTRLSRYFVKILDSSFNEVWSNYQAGYPDLSTYLRADGASGRYVMIQLEGTNPLSLAEVQVLSTGTSSNIVTMRKRNSSGYGLDGGNGAADGQNVYLWSQNSNNVNQQWEEIDRGNGYYSYQKAGTNYSLDGGNGGGNGQNLYLWNTSATNYNQQWKKVQISGNIYLLQKRNASGYSLDGGNGGANGQNVYLWGTNTGNQNQHWIFE